MKKTTTSKKTTTKKPAKKDQSLKRLQRPHQRKPQKRLLQRNPLQRKPKKKFKKRKNALESYKKAGEIAKKVKTFIRPKIKPGVKVIELVDLAEKKIIELGGKTGFPVNISINHIAAHYTPPPGDT